MTLHLCEWKYFLPYDDHILPNIVVKILPSSWKACSVIMGAIFATLIYATRGRGKSLGLYNDDTKQEQVNYLDHIYERCPFEIKVSKLDDRGLPCLPKQQGWPHQEQYRHLYKSGSTTTMDVPNNIIAHQYYRVCLCNPPLLKSSQVLHVVLILGITHESQYGLHPDPLGPPRLTRLRSEECQDRPLDFMCILSSWSNQLQSRYPCEPNNFNETCGNLALGKMWFDTYALIQGVCLQKKTIFFKFSVILIKLILGYMYN